MKMGLTKKILLTWLAVEGIALCVALPATSQIVDRVMFTAAPRAAHTVTQIKPGHAQILVASNAPFSILSQGGVGDMNMEMTINGTIHGKSFGGNAAHPGAMLACVTATSPAASLLYAGTKRTAANRGHVLTQAVMIDITYDPAIRPKFSVKTNTDTEAKTATPTPACAKASA